MPLCCAYFKSVFQKTDFFNTYHEKKRKNINVFASLSVCCEEKVAVIRSKERIRYISETTLAGLRRQTFARRESYHLKRLSYVHFSSVHGKVVGKSKLAFNPLRTGKFSGTIRKARGGGNGGFHPPIHNQRPTSHMKNTFFIFYGF